MNLLWSEQPWFSVPACKLNGWQIVEAEITVGTHVKHSKCVIKFKLLILLKTKIKKKEGNSSCPFDKLGLQKTLDKVDTRK